MPRMKSVFLLRWPRTRLDSRGSYMYVRDCANPVAVQESRVVCDVMSVARRARQRRTRLVSVHTSRVVVALTLIDAPHSRSLAHRRIYIYNMDHIQIHLHTYTVYDTVLVDRDSCT